ncbi:MAG: flippase-like domain-containing protein [Deltaproteobacteria bacterium]|nr:flippase-like domain-containing protein [Deltaproteobacteria bacterium]
MNDSGTAETAPSEAKTGGLAKKILLATLFGALVFAGLALYSDVQELTDNLGRYQWRYFVYGLGLATANYALRFLRWQYYLARLKVPLGAPNGVPTGDSARIFVAGFVMSVTPGKVGEVFKSVLLQSSHGVPLARTAPIVVAERLTDLLALVLLTAIASLAFEGGALIALAGGAFVAVIWVACAWRPLGELGLRIAGKLPVLNRLEERLREAYDALHELVRPTPLAVASLLALVSWGLECVSLLVIALGFEGVVLSLLEATFAYGGPTIVGALVLLPGGLGATEAGMTGVLEAFEVPGMTTSVAIAITMLVRLATLWWAVVLGVFALAWHRARERGVLGGASA